ncbi:MAG: sulfatase [Anaerolineales bacterium]|nr:sulfatase [Anaerolineales bacterium]
MKHTDQISRRDFIKLIGSASVSLLAASNHITRGMSIPTQSISKKPNILILVFDTLSAPHMSLHGYQRETTPNMNRFAERAFVYHKHYAAGNFTSPGTASLLTGVYPWQHGAVNINGIVTQEYSNQNIFSLLKSSYYTAAYTHNALAGIFLNQFAGHIQQFHPMRELSLAGEVYSERVMSEQFPDAFWSETMLRGKDQFLPGSLLISSLEKGFRDFQVASIEAKLQAKYPKGVPYNFKGMHFLLEDAMDWIKEQVSAYPQPFLAYYHLWPPHHPYFPSAEFIDIFKDGKRWPGKPENAFSLGEPENNIQRSRQQYDEYLAYTDYEFGRLLDMLDGDGSLDNTMVVVTSDHGELFERGLTGHLNSTLYQDLIRVPLLISLPGQSERHDVFSTTSCVDLLPSILQFSGLEVPGFVQGEVLPGFGPANTDNDRSILAMDAKFSSKRDPTQVYTLAMMEGRYKLVRYQGYAAEMDDELYDLENDPEEMENLASVNKKLVDEMGAELKRKLEKELGG